MEKAMFAAYDLKTRKISGNTPVQYNPEDCKLDKHNKTGSNMNFFQEYIGKEPSTLTMELLFDSYIHGAAKQADVRESQDCYMLLRTNLIMVDSDIHAPPAVQFSWGSMLFVGMLVKLEERYTMFSNSGLPLRARVKVELVGNSKEELNAKPGNSPDRTKLHTLRQGETLWEISNREYGSIDQWRVIADANKISNPRRLITASHLRIPALPSSRLK